MALGFNIEVQLRIHRKEEAGTRHLSKLFSLALWRPNHPQFSTQSSQVDPELVQGDSEGNWL
jgi:hypothetical protein